MNAIAMLRTALSAMASNKLRSGLTLLGIVIGVASVITLMAIGRGAQESVTSRITQLGTDLVFVRPGSTSTGNVFGGQGSARTLTLADAEAMADPTFVPAAKVVAPEIDARQQVVALGENTFTSILGVTSDYFPARNFDLASGRLLTPADVINRTEVAVLGSQTSETLFGGRDPVGSSVKINGRAYTVVGVLKSKGGTAQGLQDDQVFVPITTAAYRIARDTTPGGDILVNSITVQARDGKSVDSLVSQLNLSLTLRHRIGASDTPDFTITTQADAIDTLSSTTQTFVVFLAAIAGISLLVGGIGIMNIMLVSVTERTREIGIRRAIGAKKRDILFQFVTEATMLSLGGGLIGIGAGILLSWLADGRSLGGSTFQTVITADIAVIALIVSLAIGLFFGIYPAGRAASLDPVEALRYQ